MQKPATSALNLAHAAEHLRSTLTYAMRLPVPALCLEITAEPHPQLQTAPMPPPICAPPVEPKADPSIPFKRPQQDRKCACTANMEDSKMHPERHSPTLCTETLWTETSVAFPELTEESRW